VLSTPPFAGQQVEVVELTSPEVALVRLAAGEGAASGRPPAEGLVPISCLKLSPLKALSQTAPRAAESEQGKQEYIAYALANWHSLQGIV